MPKPKCLHVTLVASGSVGGGGQGVVGGAAGRTPPTHTFNSEVLRAEGEGDEVLGIARDEVRAVEKVVVVAGVTR